MEKGDAFSPAKVCIYTRGKLPVVSITGLRQIRPDKDPAHRMTPIGYRMVYWVRAANDLFLPNEMHHTKLIYSYRRIKPGRYSRARFIHNQIFAERLALVHAL